MESRIRAYLEDKSVLMYFPTDHFSVHDSGYTEDTDTMEIGVFMPLAQVDHLITALQRITDEETARYYADSELVGSPQEER